VFFPEVVKSDRLLDIGYIWWKVNNCQSKDYFRYPLQIRGGQKLKVAIIMLNILLQEIVTITRSNINSSENQCYGTYC
jgi:hypothetical protein